MYIKSNEIERIKRLLIDYEITFEHVIVEDGVEKVVDKFLEEDYYQSSEEDYYQPSEEYYESSC